MATNQTLLSRKFYKHYMFSDKLADNYKSFFSIIVIAGIHENREFRCFEFGDNESHYHVVGEAKYSNRILRDMSAERLAGADITGGSHARDLFLLSRQKHMVDEAHFDNTIKYINRQCGEILLDNSSKFTWPKNHAGIFGVIDDIMEPENISTENMMEFRKRYPVKDSWKNLAFKKGISSKIIDELEKMERVRQREDESRVMTTSELKQAASQWPVLEVCKKLLYLCECMPQNTGYSLILCGVADTFKSTITRILARTFGPYCVWNGSQFMQRDILKYDTPAKKGIKTIVVEEMRWVDTTKKITLEHTLNTLKEQLIGAGQDVRLAKNTKSNIDLKLKIERMFISMNPSREVDFKTLLQSVQSKPEWTKRFIVYNMDQHIQEFKKLRANPANIILWANASEMEDLLAKVLSKQEYLERAEFEFDESSQDSDNTFWLQNDIVCKAAAIKRDLDEGSDTESIDKKSKSDDFIFLD